MLSAFSQKLSSGYYVHLQFFPNLPTTFGKLPDISTRGMQYRKLPPNTCSFNTENISVPVEKGNLITIFGLITFVNISGLITRCDLSKSTALIKVLILCMDIQKIRHDPVIFNGVEFNEQHCMTRLEGYMVRLCRTDTIAFYDALSVFIKVNVDRHGSIRLINLFGIKAMVFEFPVDCQCFFTVLTNTRYKTYVS